MKDEIKKSWVFFFKKINWSKSSKPKLVFQIQNLLNPRSKLNKEAQFNVEGWNNKKHRTKICQSKKSSNKKIVDEIVKKNQF